MCVWLVFVKQKSAYDERISDCSSYVCASDLWCCGNFRRAPVSESNNTDFRPRPPQFYYKMHQKCRKYVGFQRFLGPFSTGHPSDPTSTRRRCPNSSLVTRSWCAAQRQRMLSSTSSPPLASGTIWSGTVAAVDRKSTRLNSSH